MDAGEPFMKQSHLKRGSKFVFASLVLGAFTYLLSVLLVDYIGLTYWLYGLIVLPINYVSRYLINNYWVWKEEKKVEVEDIDLVYGFSGTKHKRG